MTLNINQPGRTRQLATVPHGSLMIHEIYRSIQGEGSHVGWPCVFVRTSMCNLRCKYCDTTEAFSPGTIRNISSIIEQVKGLQCPLVEITGGEPLLQPGTLDLASQLCDHGYRVLIETSGAIPIKAIDFRVVRILDIKTPGSGESAANYWPNMEWLRKTDEVKFVLTSHQDFLWSIDVVNAFDLDSRVSVWFSPSWGQVSYRDLAAWVLESRRNVRVGMQLHKFIWGPSERSV